MGAWYTLKLLAMVVSTGMAASTGGQSNDTSSTINLAETDETLFMSNHVTDSLNARSELTLISQVVDGTPLPRFEVDLDEPPRLRWEAVMTANRLATRRTMTYLFDKVPVSVHAQVDKLVAEGEESVPEWAREEMQGIADVLNVTLADVVLVNLFFEITPFCTSIVTQSCSTGRVHHARNMDFGLGMPALSEKLRDIAVDVAFLKAGKPAFVITTFAGYIGAATGMRLGEGGLFSITANEREMTGPVPVPNIFKSILNLVDALMTTDAFPVTWAVREVLEDDSTHASFDAAVSALSTRPFATQMYMTIGGTAAGQGVVLTRDHNKLLDTWRMNATSGGWYLVQTNYDHWLPMPPWDNRKKPAEKALNEVGAAAITQETIYEAVLSRDPVLNKLTVYSTTMSCGEGKYDSFVRTCDSCSPFR